MKQSHRALMTLALAAKEVENQGESKKTNYPFLDLPQDMFARLCSFVEVKDLLTLEETSIHLHECHLFSIWSHHLKELWDETATKKDYKPLEGIPVGSTPTKQPFPEQKKRIAQKGLYFREYACRVRVVLALVLQVVKKIVSQPNGWVFNVPVDPIELGLPDYF